MQRSQLSFSEVEISVAFYDAAADLPMDSFEEVTNRVFGSQGFAKYPHPKDLERECRTMFDLARL